MKNLLVVMLFSALLVGCMSAPVYVEPMVIPTIEASGNLVEVHQHSDTQILPDGRVITNTSTDRVEMSKSMGQFKLGMAMIAAPKPKPRPEPEVIFDPCSGDGDLVPAMCWGPAGGQRVSAGYNVVSGVTVSTPRNNANNPPPPPPPITYNYNSGNNN